MVETGSLDASAAPRYTVTPEETGIPGKETGKRGAKQAVGNLLKRQGIRIKLAN
jgi:hypothetical protein